MPVTVVFLAYFFGSGLRVVAGRRTFMAVAAASRAAVKRTGKGHHRMHSKNNQQCKRFQPYVPGLVQLTKCLV